MDVLKNLIHSEKAVAVGLLVIAASVLAAIGKLSIQQWIEYTQWMAAVYVGGKTAQGVAAKVSEAQTAKSELAALKLALQRADAQADTAAAAKP